MPYRQFPWSDLRLTARGWAAVAVVVAAVGLAWLFGERALNAVAVTALVGLGAGLAQVVLSGDPVVERSPPEPGFPGEKKAASVTVEGGGMVVDVAETVPENLYVDVSERTIASPGSLSYTVEYRPSTIQQGNPYTARGVYDLGPTTVTVRDIFGLVERAVDCGGTDEVVVYPQVYELEDTTTLSSLLARARTADRQEFDDIREYAPGDPLRDIHWKSSAKRNGDLVVKEFAGREPEGSIEIAATVTAGQADLAASAVATVAVALLETGLSITVVLPEERFRVDAETDRAVLFRALAELDTGSVDSDAWERADVTVATARGTTTVTVGTRSIEFERLHGASTRERSAGDAGGQTGVTPS